MALLNPPELRASMMSVIVLYLAQCRRQSDERVRIVDAISPPSLTESPEKHQLDTIRNLTSAIEIGLVARDGNRLRLSPESTKAASKGTSAIAAHIRQRVLSSDLNTAPWGSQEGARDLTNALSWFLTFGPANAPARMEGDPPSVKFLQEADFGARHSDDDDASGWPISNSTRWNAFQRWACSLGFAWRSPVRRLVPGSHSGRSRLDSCDIRERIDAGRPILRRSPRCATARLGVRRMQKVRRKELEPFVRVQRGAEHRYY